MLESKMCEVFYQHYLQLRNVRYFENRAFVFHVANERKTSYVTGARLKKMGVVAGVPDYCILLKGGLVAFIEFKRDAKCKLSKSQLYFRDLCDTLEIPYLLTWNIDEAIGFIKSL